MMSILASPQTTNLRILGEFCGASLFRSPRDLKALVRLRQAHLQGPGEGQHGMEGRELEQCPHRRATDPP